MLWPETKRVKAVWNLDHMKRRVTLKQTLTTVLRRRPRFIRLNMGRNPIGWLERERVWSAVVKCSVWPLEQIE